MKPRPRSLANHGAKDTGADRLLVLVDQHGGVAVETDHAAIGATHVLLGADDHRAVNVALLDLGARLRFLDRHDDDVARPTRYDASTRPAP